MRLYIIYISAPRVQRLLLKFFNVFPYAIIISNLCVFVKHFRNRSFFLIWRIAQIPNVWNIPNIPDNQAARFFRRRPYIPAPESWLCASEKLTAIAPAEEGRIYIIYICIPPLSSESVQPKNKRTRNQTGIRRTTQQGLPLAQYVAPSRLQTRLKAPPAHTTHAPLQVTSSQFKRRCRAFLRLIDAFYDV